ncbi:NAD-dependent succinate-semialdehyde dehydrogenase [Candidatus Altiarchaeota archaeon]
MRSINPYTEEVLEEYETLTTEQLRSEVEKTRTAFKSWREMPVSERAKLIKAAGDHLRKNKRRYGETITREMGKPIKESVAEVEKCGWLCDYYSEEAESFLKDEIVDTGAKRSYVTLEPLGVILCIMPWNYPFWQVFRFAIPALAAGNVCLLKHASNVPRCALDIEEVFNESGFPTDVFKTLLIGAGSAMDLIEEDLIDGVSLTGSNEAGSKVGEAAGKRVIRQVLELGGSDPFIVLEDADLEKAAKVAAKGRLVNAGQSCIAAKRMIVMEQVADEFREKLVQEFKSFKIGDPMDEDTDMGPVAKKEFSDELREQLKDAEQKGGKVFLGPAPPEDKGFFCRPAVVTNVKKDMRIIREEVFGPITPIIVVKSEQEAIDVANDTEYGLGAAIWTKDTARAERISKDIQSGFVAVNGMVKSDPRLPFGGMKKSGVGRELSHYGIKEFVNIKTVVVND